VLEVPPAPSEDAGMKIIMLGVLSLWVATAQAEKLSAVNTGQLTQAGSKVELPGLVIHGGEKKFIEVTGKVALTNGILEFLAVEPGGREYESLFAITCKPAALQFALLLIGCEPGVDPYGGMPAWAKVKTMPGDAIQIEVEWEQAGKPQRVPVQEWVLDRKTKQPPAKIEWYFSGSYFTKDLDDKDVFLADSEQAHIAMWLNPSIPVNVRGEFGNPYQGDDQGFEVNTAKTPPVGTPVKLILRKK